MFSWGFVLTLWLGASPVLQKSFSTCCLLPFLAEAFPISLNPKPLLIPPWLRRELCYRGWSNSIFLLPTGIRSWQCFCLECMPLLWRCSGRISWWLFPSHVPARDTRGSSTDLQLENLVEFLVEASISQMTWQVYCKAHKSIRVPLSLRPPGISCSHARSYLTTSSSSKL